MRLFALLVFAPLFAFSSAHAAEDHGSKAEALTMVKRIQEMFRKDGAQVTFKAVFRQITF